MMVTLIQKFVERGAYGEGPGRTAYVLKFSSLPQAAQDMNWEKADSFSAAEEVLNDAALKAVFEAAIDNGLAIIQRV